MKVFGQKSLCNLLPWLHAPNLMARNGKFNTKEEDKCPFLRIEFFLILHDNVLILPDGLVNKKLRLQNKSNLCCY